MTPQPVDADSDRFRDLSTGDVMLGFVFGIAISEAAAVLVSISHSGQEATGMLAGGLFLAARLCWPMSRRAWFWPFILAIASVDAVVVAEIPWPTDRVPGAQFVPLLFLEIWLSIKAAEWIDRFTADS